MPNWVSNRLTISGPPDEIDRFAAVAGTMTRATQKFGPPKSKTSKGKRQAVEEENRLFRPEVLAFEHIVPIPKKIPKSYHRGKSPFPVDIRWCLKNWGTKWDAHCPAVKRVYRNRIRYWFSTAWDGPIEWLVKVSRKFPTLTFTLKYWRDGEWQTPCEFSKGKGYLVEKSSTTKG